MASEFNTNIAIEIVKAMAAGGNRSIDIAYPKSVNEFIESVANKLDELNKEK